MNRYEIIDDTMFAAIPAEDAKASDVTDRMTRLALDYIHKQYQGFLKPLSVEMSPVEWTLTDDLAEAQAFALSHECETCEEGKRRAVEYLRQNPERFLLMANLRYVEEWPPAQ